MWKEIRINTKTNAWNKVKDLKVKKISLFHLSRVTRCVSILALYRSVKCWRTNNSLIISALHSTCSHCVLKKSWKTQCRKHCTTESILFENPYVLQQQSAPSNKTQVTQKGLTVKPYNLSHLAPLLSKFQSTEVLCVWRY